MKPARRRMLACWMIGQFRVSTLRACRLARFSRSAYYRGSAKRDLAGLQLRIRDIAHARPRYGYRRITVVLRREGWHVNYKRVHRLYQLEGLQIRMRVRLLSRDNQDEGLASIKMRGDHAASGSCCS